MRASSAARAAQPVFRQSLLTKEEGPPSAALPIAPFPCLRPTRLGACAPIRLCGQDARCASGPHLAQDPPSGLPTKGDISDHSEAGPPPGPASCVSRERAAVDPSSPAALGL